MDIEHEHLTNLPILNYTHVKPVLLIGLDNAHLGLPQNIVKKETTHPIAINTKLGRLAYGPGQQMSKNAIQKLFKYISWKHRQNGRV